MIFFVVDVEDGGVFFFLYFFFPFCFLFVMGVHGSIKGNLLPLCPSLRRLQWCWLPQLRGRPCRAKEGDMGWQAKANAPCCAAWLA